MDVLENLPKHPNIVSFYGVSRKEYDGGRKVELYILLELCAHTLASVLNSQITRPLSENQVIHYFLPICEGVKHMHCQPRPIVHRDLKLENVLINFHGELKLCDFGSCTRVQKVYESASEIADLEEQVQKFTTSIFRAPEQVDLYSRKFVGVEVDVWALGCILYFLLFRRHAFPTAASNQIVSARYEIPENDYSEPLLNLLSQILNPDPLHRPSSTQVVTALEDLLKKRFDNQFLAHPLVIKTEKHTKLEKHGKSKKEHIKSIQKIGSKSAKVSIETPATDPVRDHISGSDWDPFQLPAPEKAASPIVPVTLASEDDDFDPFSGQAFLSAPPPITRDNSKTSKLKADTSFENGDLCVSTADLKLNHSTIRSKSKSSAANDMSLTFAPPLSSTLQSIRSKPRVDLPDLSPVFIPPPPRSLARSKSTQNRMVVELDVREDGTISVEVSPEPNQSKYQYFFESKTDSFPASAPATVGSAAKCKYDFDFGLIETEAEIAHQSNFSGFGAVNDGSKHQLDHLQIPAQSAPVSLRKKSSVVGCLSPPKLSLQSGTHQKSAAKKMDFLSGLHAKSELLAKPSHPIPELEDYEDLRASDSYQKPEKKGGLFYDFAAAIAPVVNSTLLSKKDAGLLGDVDLR